MPVKDAPHAAQFHDFAIATPIPGRHSEGPPFGIVPLNLTLTLILTPNLIPNIRNGGPSEWQADIYIIYTVYKLFLTRLS